MKRFLRKALRWAGILLATLAVLLLVFYAEEDWRGARDWAACQRDLAAKGETLDLRQLVPPGNPADDLSKVPIFAELFKDYPSSRLSHVRMYLEKRVKDDLMPGGTTRLAEGKPLDLARWQKYYRSVSEPWMPQAEGTPAQDVLLRLSHFDPEMKEVEETLRSNPDLYWPLSCVIPSPPFPLVPASGYVNLLSGFTGISGVLQLQGVAHLENGEAEKAEQDFLFNQQIAQALLRTPFLINSLMAYHVMQTGEGVLWEGIRRHSWSETQLKEMEKSLASVNLLKGYREVLRCDRVLSLECLSHLENGRPFPVPYTPGKKAEMDVKYLLMKLGPQGRTNQAKSYFCEEVQKRIEAVDLGRDIMTPTEYSEPKKFRNVLFLDNLVGINDTGFRAAQAETYRRLARLACRLEEYRIAHGTYPDKLDDLPDLPAHLNQEVLSQQPLQYHRQGDGYQLYSLGWNQKDDGGTYNADPQQGDWPWPSP